MQCLILQEAYKGLMREGTEAVAYSRTGDKGSKEYLYDKLIETLSTKKFNVYNILEFGERAPPDFSNTSIKNEFFTLFSEALREVERQNKGKLLPLEEEFVKFMVVFTDDIIKKNLYVIKEYAQKALSNVDFNFTDIFNFELRRAEIISTEIPSGLWKQTHLRVEEEVAETYLETAKQIASGRRFFEQF